MGIMGLMLLISLCIGMVAFGVLFSAPPPLGKAFCSGCLFPVIIMCVAVFIGALIKLGRPSDIDGLVNLVAIIDFGSVSIAGAALICSGLMHLKSPGKYLLAIKIAVALGLVYVMFIPLWRYLALHVKIH